MLQDEVVGPVRDVGVVAVGEEEPDAVGGDGHEGEGDGLGGRDAGEADQGGEVAAVDVTAKKKCKYQIKLLLSKAVYSLTLPPCKPQPRWWPAIEPLSW